MVILSVMSISCDKTSLGGNGSGNGGNDGPLPELSPLEEVDNVCTKMDDLGFMSYCYENFDVNKDGKVSMAEASAAKSIACSKASSFAGLEYFNNLKNFESHSVETVDFRYNTMLETIDCSESKVTKVDLRYNKNLLLFSFDGCSLLTAIGGIPDSVTEISNSTFSGCSSLTDIDIPDGVTKIGSYAFYGCSSLTAIDIPDSVTEIGGSAFEGCSSLTAIDIPDGVTEISSTTFYDCSSLTDINIPDSVTEIGGSAFSHCSSLTDINIPDSVTEIGGSAFSHCSSLTAIDIPDGVTEISSTTFYDCSSLTDINIPDSVTEIGGSAFEGCSSLTAIDIPDGVTEIHYKAFCNCYSLRKVNAKNCDALSRIYNRAFSNCPIKEFLLGAVNVPEFAVVNDTTPTPPFSYKNHILKVPAESVEAYKNSEWAEYFETIEAL